MLAFPADTGCGDELFPVEGWTEGKDRAHSRGEGPWGFIGQLQPASCHLKLYDSFIMCVSTCGYIHVGACVCPHVGAHMWVQQ